MSSLPVDYVVGHLRCDFCGRETECTLSQANEYVAKNEWPVCCRYIMILVLGTDVPTDDRFAEPPDCRNLVVKGKA
jgi:hypothetical protein